MQVKKFEAPTLQEALDNIKREMGPEAIILQTKKHKKGFGLMSRPSVEVTVAVSDRALQRKTYVEKKLPDPLREQLQSMPASKQAKVYEKSESRHLDAALRGSKDVQDNVQLSKKRMTITRYADIDDEEAGKSIGSGRSAAGAAGAAVARGARNAVNAMAQMAGQGRTAARQYSAAQGIDAAGAGAGAASGAVAGAMAIESAMSPAGPAVGHRMPIDEEVRHLKRMIEEMKSLQDDKLVMGGASTQAQKGSLGTPALQDAFEQLVLNGLDRRYALQLVKKVAFELGEQKAASPDEVMDQLAMEIMESIEVMNPIASIQGKAAAVEHAGSEPVLGPQLGGAPQAQLQVQAKMIAFVGPTGVGKTTTIAKIASEALIRRNLKVGLINLDSYKVAAFDQLATYAKILNVPFRSAASAEDLKAAIEDFKVLDLILIDTTGRSQRDPESLKEMQALLAAVPGITTQLVLSATTRDAELYDMSNRFSMFRPGGVILSKLDEATVYGAIYNVSQRTQLPLLYFTTGQRVPEDIEEATRERVAALILDL